MVPFVIGVVVIVIGVAAVMVLRGTRETQSIEDRLNELAALGEPVTLEQLELSQPFSERVIVPMVERLSEMSQRFTPEQVMDESRHQLELAGMAHKVSAVQFSGYRLAAALGLGVVSIILVLSMSLPAWQKIGAVIFGLVFGYYLPNIWLGSKISQRQNEVLKALPDALDLLTICVEAGLGFDAAMAKVADKWDNELSLAFTRTVQEMQLGKTRREALRDMAMSMDVSDVTTFVAAIVQADQLGVSMAKVMRIQSDTMRMKRRQRAEEKANQAPVKMMIPLVFLVFPPLFIVLMGPAVIKFKNMDSS
ncbi:MAG: type II secretion system F family protein [Anaerolineales bacterium]